MVASRSAPPSAALRQRRRRRRRWPVRGDAPPARRRSRLCL